MKTAPLFALVMSFGILAGLPAMSAADTAPLPQPTTVPRTLVEGTTVRLMYMEKLESGRVRTGKTVHLQVAEDVVDPHGNVLIRRGTPAMGVVTKSSRALPFGKSGKLNIEITHTMAVDGQTVPLRTLKRHSGHHGHNFIIEPGREVMAYVDTNVPVTIQR